jgi:hypothetical protein
VAQLCVNTLLATKVTLITDGIEFGTLRINVDNITNFVHFHVRRQWNGPMFTEFAEKQIPCTSPIAFGVRHLE